MKKEQAINIYRLMSGIKVSKIRNKETRKTIIKNHLALYKAAKEYDDDVAELRKKIFDGKDEEQKQLAELREQFQSETNPENRLAIVNRIKNEFGELVSIEREFSEEVQGLLDEEADISLTKLGQDEFLAAAVDAEYDITNADLITLQDMFNE